MSDPENNLRLEIGHVLFIDPVGYSGLLIEEQEDRLRQLTEIVLATSQVAKSTNEQLVWQLQLHDLGECEVKHGVRMSVVNLHADGVGNPHQPKRFQALTSPTTR